MVVGEEGDGVGGVLGGLWPALGFLSFVMRSMGVMWLRGWFALHLEQGSSGGDISVAAVTGMSDSWVVQEMWGHC